jgi:glycosyltransferase involved in cell wall biosynthesis
MPVYNGERYLASAIEASLGQSYTDFELILSDNASTDSTAEICREYARRDARVRYVRNSTNIGMAGNYNSAFRQSVGEYFRWAAGDDLFAPESLERCVQVLDREPEVVLCYPRTVMIDEHGNRIGEYDDNLNLPHDRPSDRFIAAMEQMTLVNVHFGLMRSRALGQTCIYHAGPAGDLAFVVELAFHGKFVAINEPLFFRRVHERSSGVIGKKSLVAVQDYLDPGRKITGWFHWRLLFQYFGAVLRPTIPLAERLRALRYMCGMIVWNRQKYVRELRSVLFGQWR